MSDRKSTIFEIRTGDINSWNVISGDTPVVLNDYKILLGRNREPHSSLESFSDLSQTDDLEMRLNINGKHVNVDLPAPMMGRLVRYLADDSYPFNKNFDCLSFVHRMIGEDYHFKDGVDLEKFKMPKVDTFDQVEPGDVVHMAQGDTFINKEAKHAAIYIGNELFLSKFGVWKIGVQQLDQLRQVYGDCSLFKQVRK